MQETNAIEIKLRTGAEGVTRHALAEGAPESFCGVDRSILVDSPPHIAPAINCAVCMAAVRRWQTRQPCAVKVA